MPKLYFGRLTLYDEEGRIYEVKNTKVTRAIPELNRILQARGIDIKFTLTEEER
ncbi:MAG: hypothetical protein QMD46_12615 [Methanomicrobiales archaeon]|nr:hypothetical protein [Methanomicrobiales archaeon]